MKIQNQEKDGEGIFYIYHNGETVAELVYSVPSSNRIVIEHTGVDQSLEGKGLGKQLVEAAVEHAKARQIKIFPKCSFAKSMMELVPEWKDVLSTS